MKNPDVVVDDVTPLGAYIASYSRELYVTLSNQKLPRFSLLAILSGHHADSNGFQCPGYTKFNCPACSQTKIYLPILQRIRLPAHLFLIHKHISGVVVIVWWKRHHGMGSTNFQQNLGRLSMYLCNYGIVDFQSCGGFFNVNFQHLILSCSHNIINVS